METIQILEAKLEASKTINSAKHKAAGKTHRVEFSVCNARGKYLRTAVLYVSGLPDSVQLAKMALVQGTKSMSASVSSAIVSVL